MCRLDSLLSIVLFLLRAMNQRSPGEQKKCVYLAVFLLLPLCVALSMKGAMSFLSISSVKKMTVNSSRTNSPMDNNKSTLPLFRPNRVYHCGYNLQPLVSILFPEFEDAGHYALGQKTHLTKTSCSLVSTGIAFQE